MVVIRLARGGSKKNPFYQIVVTDSRRARDSGNYVEKLGYFNAIARGQATEFNLSKERYDHWVGQGAVPSERVANLVKQFGKGQLNQVTPTRVALKKQQLDEANKAHEKRAQVAAKEKAAEEKAAVEAAKVEAAAAKAEEKAAETAPAAEAPKAEEKPAEQEEKSE